MAKIQKTWTIVKKFILCCGHFVRLPLVLREKMKESILRTSKLSTPKLAVLKNIPKKMYDL